jgi:hypothetical protein
MYHFESLLKLRLIDDAGSCLFRTPMLPVPLELALKITSYLTRKDKLAFSLVSHNCRDLVLPVLFSKVELTECRKNVKEGLEFLDGAGNNVKGAIRYSSGNVLWTES